MRARVSLISIEPTERSCPFTTRGSGKHYIWLISPGGIVPRAQKPRRKPRREGGSKVARLRLAALRRYAFDD